MTSSSQGPAHDAVKPAGRKLRRGSRRSGNRRAWRRQLIPWIFISPWVLLFLAFTLFPLLFSIYLSFQEWNPVAGMASMRYVGLDNYYAVLTDPWLRKSLYNTAWLAIATSLPQHLIAIPAAYFLVTCLSDRWRHLCTAVLFIPFVMSTVAVSMVFFTIYAGHSGILNQTLVALSRLPFVGALFSWVPDAMPINWLSTSALIKPAITLVVIWKYTGFNIVIYSAGFLTVPRDLCDSARVDGCNQLQQFWHVALPLIRPFVFFAVTLSIIGSIQLFEEPYVLTNGDSGGVGQSGLTTTYYLYMVGWEWLEMGSASAISWILFIFIALATSVHFWLSGRRGLEGLNR